jgi:hypothetical protein
LISSSYFPGSVRLLVRTWRHKFENRGISREGAGRSPHDLLRETPTIVEAPFLFFQRFERVLHVHAAERSPHLKIPPQHSVDNSSASAVYTQVQ